MPEGLELEYFIYSCTDEVYNEHQIKDALLKDVITRKCFKNHENYVQKKLYDK